MTQRPCWSCWTRSTTRDGAGAEEAVNAVGKAVDELQLMTMLNGEYDHSNAILTFHAGTGGTEHRTGPRCSTGCTTSGRRLTA